MPAATHYPAIFPHLRYESPKEAVSWLTRVFGFREKVRLAAPDGAVHIAELECPGGGLLMIGWLSPEYHAVLKRTVPGFHQPDEKAFPYLSHSTTVLMDDVDAHFEHAKREGAMIVSQPQDQPYGMRVYVALDLDGHRWQFGQRLGDVAPEAWGATRVG